MNAALSESMKTTIRRKLFRLGCPMMALLLLFFYGVAVGLYRCFPYNQLRAIWHCVPIVTGPSAEDVQSVDTSTSGKEKPPGRWKEARRAPAETPAETDMRMKLGSIGYLGGYNLAGHASGTTICDTNSVARGLTLFCSGHAPVVYLISLSGEIIHKWETEFDSICPSPPPFNVKEEHKQFIRRARVLPNGDLIAIFEGIGIFKLDRNSTVLWKNLNRGHHDFVIADDGSIIMLTQRRVTSDEVSKRYPGFKCAKQGICDDQIAILDPSGNETGNISLFEAFYRSDYAPFLMSKQGVKDIFHANSVQIIGNRHGTPIIAPGEILVSLRTMDAIVSVNVEKKRVSWMLTGKWKAQHQASILENGNILMLDNRGGNKQAPLQLDQSQALEVNPHSQKIEWRYAGSDSSPFFTHWLGYIQRLKNNNTLITESSQGRIFEVSPEGRIVWEYMNPHRAGKDDELIATVMGAQRIDPDDLPFLED